jgi:hypothetical protein
METTTETPQMAKVVKVSKGQISTLLEVFKYIGLDDLETIAYRLKEIAFCIGVCDKGTNELKHLMETLQDIDSICGFLSADELQEVITTINTTEDFREIDIQITD